MKESYQMLEILGQHPQKLFVKATVIRVKGSSYRNEGAKMLFSDNEKQFGTISAGCIEEDLSYKSKEVMLTRKPMIVTYDLRSEDDLDWGLGAGCNGRIDVYLEPVQWNDRNKQILKHLNLGRKVASARVLEPVDLQMNLVLTEEGHTIGGIPKLQVHILEKLTEFLREDQIIITEVIGESKFLFELYEPNDKLFIFGAGPDVEPLVKLVKQYHFLPIIIDLRSSRCNREVFPDAHSFICEHPERLIANENFDRNSLVLIMTHSFTKDKKIVNYFIKKRPKYIGILGPKQRTERLLFPHSVPKWVHSPVGVNIYAEGPEEISVSIVAELIKVRNEQRVLMKKQKINNL
ncbi:XdhC family protein [Anaerobacillus alkalilacustris]|nr:XdhC family protein [Anaerobacillus alkalilacustris]